MIIILIQGLKGNSETSGKYEGVPLVWSDPNADEVVDKVPKMHKIFQVQLIKQKSINR